MLYTLSLFKVVFGREFGRWSFWLDNFRCFRLLSSMVAWTTWLMAGTPDPSFQGSNDCMTNSERQMTLSDNGVLVLSDERVLVLSDKGVLVISDNRILLLSENRVLVLSDDGALTLSDNSVLICRTKECERCQTTECWYYQTTKCYYCQTLECTFRRRSADTVRQRSAVTVSELYGRESDQYKNAYTSNWLGSDQKFYEVFPEGSCKPET